MRTLKFLLQKEFRQIFRDRGIVSIIFMIPIIQLLILPWAADYEIKNIKLAVVDHDHSEYARQLINKVTASGYFILTNYSASYNNGIQQVERDKADLILEIPAYFEKDLVKENEAKLFLAVNAINGVKAGLGSAYLRSIIQDYNSEVRMKWIQFPRFSPETNIEITSSNWFNPLMNYKFFMVPGILVLLLTMVGSNLTAINIVKEKEIGTFEQLIVSPLKPYQIIIGKLVPFSIIGFVSVTIVMTVMRFWFGIPVRGSVPLLFGAAFLFMFSTLGLGLFISTISKTQQQASMTAFFGIMMPMNFLSGFTFPLDNMPLVIQYITYVIPLRYFIVIVRGIILKGIGFADLKFEFLALLIFGVVILLLSSLRFRKKLE